MKFHTYLAAGIIGLGLSAAVLPGCQTASDPGVKNLLGSYSTIIDGNPDAVTTAAHKAVDQMKFTDVEATGTKIDGKVTAKTAQDVSVNIDVEKVGDKLSRVTIRVGATGDEAVSQQLLEKIKSNMHLF